MKKRNKNIVWFILAGVLILVAGYLVLSQKNTTLSADSKDFAVEDTAAIYSIKLSDKNGSSATLDRKGPGLWMVNNKWKADRRQVELLLKTLRLVEVKNPVPLKARNDVVRGMASSAIEVELKDKDGDEIKTIYVGGPVPDELGTLMLVKGAPEPMVTHIPGFNGYLTPRFSTKPQDWRGTEIYALNPSTIKQVFITYSVQPSASFTLEVKGGEFILSDPRGKRETITVPPLPSKQYLSRFRNVNWEVFAGLEKAKTDSVLASTPAAIVRVKTTTGDVSVLTLYNKLAEHTFNDAGQRIQDEERLYGTLGEGSRELLLIQIKLLEPILVSYDMIAEAAYEKP